ncbi:carboxymuconolactone decarboxylase family protein [Dactylosporangium sp. CA-052675]|uniref:carboxymuconolactone decarboxylase family protein n=1 Tax=Dactylosporangium sp. CA-052675 TaxID=3239927 RepID=UPI003D8C3F6F
MSFLGEAAPAPELFEEDLTELGYVMNVTRLWAHRPELVTGLFDLLGTAVRGVLDRRTRGILVTAAVSAFGDAYCSLAWGGKLAAEAGTEVAVAVLRGDDTGLTPAERALAGWARRIVRDPHTTTPADLDAMRAAGLDDPAILTVTVFVALRIAFATVNDALGAGPDAELAVRVPPEIRAEVTYGRPVGGK